MQRSNKPIRKPSENVSKVGTHYFLENSVSHESKDCVYDPKDMLLLQPLCPLTLHQEERRVGVLGKGPLLLGGDLSGRSHLQRGMSVGAM